jgi:hypothetical protein
MLFRRARPVFVWLARGLGALVLLVVVPAWVFFGWKSPPFSYFSASSRNYVRSSTGWLGSARTKHDVVGQLSPGRLIFNWKIESEWMPNSAGAESAYEYFQWNIPPAYPSSPVPATPWWSWQPGSRSIAGVWVNWHDESRSSTDSSTLGLGIPLWLVITLAASPIVPLLLPAARRARRRARGQCEFCGYSRSGLQDSSPCPECGRSPLLESPMKVQP